MAKVKTNHYLAEFISTGLSPEAEARIGHGILGVILHEGQSLRLINLHEHPRSVGFCPIIHP